MLKVASNQADLNVLELSGAPLSLGIVREVSRDKRSVAIKATGKTRSRVDAAAACVAQAVSGGEAIYGVTTGFGGMANQAIDCQLAGELQSNLLNFLAAGAGKPIDPVHTRGAMLLRANVLLQGKSGVRWELIERLVQLLNANAIPMVRECGSIGASGDLIPLACIARVLTGSPYVRVQIDNQVFDGKTALARLGLDPISLRPKEGLALVNGTSFSAAIAAHAVLEARQLLGFSMVAQAMMMKALLVQHSPFEPFVHAAKPHPGQVWSAEVMLKLLTDDCPEIQSPGELVQDRYSLRCFPQYMGSIVEGMTRIQNTVETEMNAVSDNPLIDPATGTFYQSGNFLGQYLAVAMDDLRRWIGLLAKHLDVQIASLVAPEFNGGLSASLRGNASRSYNMGLKGLQICGNSIMPLLTHAANPLLDHFPTHAEQFNQNVNGLSWGAANLACQSLELFQNYLAISLLVGVQAVDLRANQLLGHFDGRRILGATTREVYELVYEATGTTPGTERPFLFDDADRWLERDIEAVVGELNEESRLVAAIQPILESLDANL